MKYQKSNVKIKSVSLAGITKTDTEAKLKIKKPRKWERRIMELRQEGATA